MPDEPPTDADLRNRVRRSLASGALDRIGSQVWAGWSNGHDCIVCGSSIGRNQVEYEIVNQSGDNVQTRTAAAQEPTVPMP